jgi:hypothetical protein
MGGGMMELEVVELPEHQDEVVVNRLDLPAIFAGQECVGLHKIPHRCTAYSARMQLPKMTNRQEK